MYIISHRGLINGPNKSKENLIDNISTLAEIYPNLFFEIDVNLINNEILIGHEEPYLKVEYESLRRQKKRLILHIKKLRFDKKNSFDLFNKITSEFHYFTHDNDSFTITSLKWPWIHPKEGFLKGTIAVMPEFSLHPNKFKSLLNKDLLGICTDYPLEMIKLLSN